jgi:murein DD-endopeptidase MepM/ murein hydrolase activator NlpD
MKRKIVFVILLVIIILSVNIASTLAATKTELQNKQSEIEEQIEETEGKISNVKDEMSETMKQIQSLTAEISGYETEINELDEQLSGLEKSISDTQVKLEEAEEKYEEQEEALQARIVAQYEAGETTYLDVLLGGGSLWDMISNWQMVSDVAEMDNRLLEKIEQNRVEIEEAKKSLETNKEQVATIKNNKEATAKSLKNSQTVKEQYVSELSEDEKELNSELEKLQKENESITKELKAIESQYSDKIANLGGTGTLQRPVKSGEITATMYYSSGRYHGALDYGVPIGTEVYAAAEGVVLSAGWRSGGLGYCVILQHSNGLRTYYGHGNGDIRVSVGDVVAKGQLIMLSGNTGNSTGPHLHFEVRVSPYNWSYGGGDSRRDPRNYL